MNLTWSKILKDTFSRDVAQILKAKMYAKVVFCHFRLGGVPVGVISVETRPVELTVPADPANLDSETKVLSFCHCMGLKKK